MPLYLRTILRGLRLIIQAAPGPFWRLVALNLAFGAGPALLLWLGKVVIDFIAATAPVATAPWEWFTRAPTPFIGAVIGFVILNLALDSVETLTYFQASALRDRVGLEGQRRLLAKVAGFRSIAVFEDPRLLNLLTLAQTRAGELQWLTTVVHNMLGGLFMVIPTIALSATIGWWVPVLIFLTSIPSVWFQLEFEQRQWVVEYSQASEARKMRAQAEVLMRPAFAKDLRVYGLADFFLGRWRGLFTRLITEAEAVRRRGTIITALWSLPSGLTSGALYLYVIFQATRGLLTLGDVALFAGLIFQVRRSLFILIGNLGELQKIALAANAFFELLDYDEGESAENRVVVANHPSPIPRDTLPTFEAVNLSFTYPGAAKPAIQGINLQIAAGETVVIVGENGAGKTTLAKLLCRLYAPSEGEILLNGRDYRLFDLDMFRREVAALFQDFARFPATLRENIGFGNLSNLGSDGSIYQAASQMRLTKLVESLPKQLETPLSKELEDGVELSGGQWQRIAIARALMRSDAKLVILDEPTASLDPRTEYEALSLFREMVQGKTAVIISHRLALARIATTVIVMEHGEIIERGTHDDLMRAGGRYAEMFTRQASSYVDLDLSLLQN